MFGLAVDAREAMYEYLDMYYHLGRAGRALDRMGVVEFATTVAPGMLDVLLTGKTYEATRRRRSNQTYVYDAVVLDAPPTGRITRFLSVNTAVSSLARVGPINRQAAAITKLVTSPLTAVHLVTILEEMPVQETADAIADLEGAAIPVGAVVLNQLRPARLAARDLAAARRGRLDAVAVETGLKAAGLAGSDTLVEQLMVEARAHADRVALESRQRAAVAALARPTYELPHIADGIDLAALYDLAGALSAQGAA